MTELEVVGYGSLTHLKRIKKEASERGEASSVIYGYPAGTATLALTPLAPAQAWQARALAAEEQVRVLSEALESSEANGDRLRSEIEKYQAALQYKDNQDD